jgi:2-polyprenyl-3-methyl-5-hydroxy-6-metoxy-1,4-benzoquinol methylase
MVTGVPERGEATATPLNVSYRVDRISKYLSGHWLDFGCADGGYDEEMLARGLEAVSGVDVEESRIADAKRRKLPSAQYTTFDGRTLPFADGTFDGTFMNEVFEHVADERWVLAEIFRVLKPGGILVLISPNRWFPIDGHCVTIGSKTISPAPLIPWLPERMTRKWTVARNYWPGELERHVRGAGFAVNEIGFIWPVLERYAWLPRRGIAWYQNNFRKWDHAAVIRRFGLSTMVVGVKPAHPGSVCSKVGDGIEQVYSPAADALASN